MRRGGEAEKGSLQRQLEQGGTAPPPGPPRPGCCHVAPGLTHRKAGVDERADLPVSGVFGQTVTDCLWGGGRGSGLLPQALCRLHTQCCMAMAMPQASLFGMGVSSCCGNCHLIAQLCG